MIKITKSQKHILYTFLKYNEEMNGISSYIIGKNGIPRRTFEINRDKLLKNFLIEIVKEKKAGKQTRIFYKITSLGFFCLLTNMNLLELKKEILTKNFFDVIPLIGENWNALKKITENETMMLEVLKLSIETMDIRKWVHENRTTAGFDISIGIAFSSNFDIKFFQTFSNPYRKNFVSKVFIANRFYQKIIDMLYFSFFINLLGVYTTNEIFHGIRYKLETDIEKKIVSTSELEKYQQNWQQSTIAKKIITYFKKNKQIKNNLEKMILEFNKHFVKPPHLTMIEKVVNIK